MSDQAPHATRSPFRSSGALHVGAVAAVALVVVSLLWMAGESHYRSCIAKAEAKYPAVPVSAFLRTNTGPVKVSFVTERARAVDDCHRF